MAIYSPLSPSSLAPPQPSQVLKGLEAALVELSRRRPQPSLSYSPHQPLTQQAKFLEILRNPPEGRKKGEALYGGAAGGGKSDAILMAALEYAHVPGYAALILRRKYTDLILPGAILDRAHEWLRATDAVWSAEKKSFTFPSGATLTFGYLDNENDKYRYQGAEFQFVGFDELTQFTETQYKYLHSRTRRRVGLNVPIRVCGASNPGGVGHEWVFHRFIAANGDGLPFIPAKLSDNPHLDQETYRESLSELDAVTRAQLENGDWHVQPKGPMFDRAWFHVIDQLPIDPHTLQPIVLRCCRYWDFAATKPKQGRDPDYTAGARVGLSEDGIWYIQDMIRFRDTPLVVEQTILSTASQDGHSVQIGLEQEPGSSGVIVSDHYTRKLIGYAARADKKTGDKIELARPFSAAAQAGHVRVLRGPWNTAFFNECSGFPLVSHDDQVDAVTGAMRMLADGSPTYQDLGAGGGERRFTASPPADDWDD